MPANGVFQLLQRTAEDCTLRRHARTLILRLREGQVRRSSFDGCSRPARFGCPLVEQRFPIIACAGSILARGVVQRGIHLSGITGRRLTIGGQAGCKTAFRGHCRSSRVRVGSRAHARSNSAPVRSGCCLISASLCLSLDPPFCAGVASPYRRPTRTLPVRLGPGSSLRGGPTRTVRSPRVLTTRTSAPRSRKTVDPGLARALSSRSDEAPRKSTGQVRGAAASSAAS